MSTVAKFCLYTLIQLYSFRTIFSCMLLSVFRFVLLFPVVVVHFVSDVFHEHSFSVLLCLILENNSLFLFSNSKAANIRHLQDECVDAANCVFFVVFHELC